MNIFASIAKIFTGGAVKSIENIASEWIETDMETAEAKVLMVKTLDPNGMMRRELSRRVTALYTLYIVVTLVLLILESFGVGPMINNVLAVSTATTKVAELFVPITTLFGIIVSASFGVNYVNSKGGK
jgi:hypothetical protein